VNGRKRDARSVANERDDLAVSAGVL